MNVETIIEAVCEACGITREQYDSRSRKRKLILARAMSWKMAAVVFDLRPQEVAVRFKRDRASVRYGIAVFEERAKRWPVHEETYKRAWDLAWSKSWGKAA